MENKRILYFDYLRVFATIAVIVLHVSCDNFFVTDMLNGWQALNFYDGIVRWSVPIFVMISGSLFLSKETYVTDIYRKYIFRLVIGYVFWSAFYTFITPIGRLIVRPDFIVSYQKIMTQTHILTGEFHMWFIPMIIGLYMLIPIIKPIVKNQSLMEYFLLLSFIFAFALPEMVCLIEDFSSGLFVLGIQRINQVVLNMDMKMVAGFTFYFVIGYYLHNCDLDIKSRKIIFMLGILGFVFTVSLNAIIALKIGKPVDKYFGNHTVNVALEAISIFVLCKYSEFNTEYINKCVVKLSKYSFGAYWVHIFVRNCLNLIGLNNQTFNPFIAIPVVSFLVVVISFCISLILNKIEFVNKWLV